jgi:hypothetical protein
MQANIPQVVYLNMGSYHTGNIPEWWGMLPILVLPIREGGELNKLFVPLFYFSIFSFGGKKWEI